MNDKYLRIINEAKEDVAIEKYEKKHLKDVRRGIKSKLEYVITNYNPFIGMLPGRTQEKLKIRSRELNPLITSLSSVIFFSIGAYFVGQNLNGFDIGISVGERESINSAEVLKPIYFSLLGGGFSKLTTDIASYYFMADSIFRTAYLLYTKKPIGTSVLEFVNYLKNRFTLNKKYRKEAEKEVSLLREKNDTIEGLLG